MHGLETDIATAYRSFGEREARGYCPPYEALALGVAGDDDQVGWLAGLPDSKRQPNLLFGAVRYLGGPIDSYQDFAAYVEAHRSEVEQVMLARRTQTNESGRCATLLPWLVAQPQPIALLEVGASAGLCLYPDRYRYAYATPDGRTTAVADGVGGDDGVGSELRCAISQIPVPTTIPKVGWRGGMDLNPLDVADPDTARWLEALVWPGQHERRDRLRHAIEIARADPPHLVAGDLTRDLPALAADVPTDLHLVVFHSAVLAYVDPAGRDAFVRTVSEVAATRPVTWISNEAPTVLPAIADRLAERGATAPPEGSGSQFVLAVDGEPMAWTGPHGQSLIALGS